MYPLRLFVIFLTLETSQMLSMRRLTLLVTLLASLSKTLAEDVNDDFNGDDGMEGYNNNYSNGDDENNIKYWTEYALLPKRCIV
jgi:hypothetical protein